MSSMDQTKRDRQYGQQGSHQQTQGFGQNDTITIVTGPGTTDLFQPATSGSSKTRKLHLRNPETGQTMDLQFIDKAEYSKQQAGQQPVQGQQQVWEIIQS